MQAKTEFTAFQKLFKDIKAVIGKSPIAKSADDLKDLAGLLSADTDNNLTFEVAAKGLYLKSTFPGEVAEPGEVMLRIEPITSIKSSSADIYISHAKGEKVIKIKSGKFKVDLPLPAGTSKDIENQRPDAFQHNHTIHSSKLADAISAVDIDAVSKDEPLIAQFSFDTPGLTVYTHDASRVVLYKNNKTAYDTKLEVMLPVDILGTYLSKVDGKVKIGVTNSSFQLIADQLELTHPIRETSLSDVNQIVTDCIGSDNVNIKVKASFQLHDAIEAFSSIVAFAPDNNRILVKVDPKKGTLQCKATSPNGEGENTCAVTDAFSEDGKPVEAVLNCKFFLKLLEMLKSAGVTKTTWFGLEDRIALQSEDERVTYICAQMD